MFRRHFSLSERVWVRAMKSIPFCGLIPPQPHPLPVERERKDSASPEGEGERICVFRKDRESRR
jgi:hypothetical protein